MIVKTAVNSQLKKDALLRGSLLAGLGMLILIGGSIILTQEQLEQYGFFIFVGGIALVTFGMIPYRKLVRLENSPDEIHVNDDHAWVYYRKGKKIAEIPREAIESSDFVAHDPDYGICVQLKKNPPSKVKVFMPDAQLQMNKYGCDLFLPYFTERSMNQLSKEDD